MILKLGVDDIKDIHLQGMQNPLVNTDGELTSFGQRSLIYVNHKLENFDVDNISKGSDFYIYSLELFKAYLLDSTKQSSDSMAFNTIYAQMQDIFTNQLENVANLSHSWVNPYD